MHRIWVDGTEFRWTREDTYQAIWGLDETLPGYRRKPIGWGITRVRGP